MSRTYLAISDGPNSDRSKVRRLNAPSNLNAPASLDAPLNEKEDLAQRSVATGNGLTFTFWGGMEHQHDTVKKRAMRWALKEVYRDVTGRMPDDSDHDDKLEKAIIAHYRETKGDPNANVVLNVVTMDPNNRSESFGHALDNLESFTTHSQHMLVLDAYHQLTTLDDSKAAERDELCDKLIAMRERNNFKYSQLDGEEKEWMKMVLKNVPHVREAIGEAQARFDARKNSREGNDLPEPPQKGQNGSRRETEVEQVSSRTENAGTDARTALREGRPAREASSAIGVY